MFHDNVHNEGRKEQRIFRKENERERRRQLHNINHLIRQREIRINEEDVGWKDEEWINKNLNVDSTCPTKMVTNKKELWYRYSIRHSPDDIWRNTLETGYVETQRIKFQEVWRSIYHKRIRHTIEINVLVSVAFLTSVLLPPKSSDRASHKPVW